MEMHDIEKIKTIGDAYMAVSGLPVPQTDHAHRMVRAALDLCRFMEDWKKEKQKKGQTVFELRVGLHTGPVVAGIVGMKKFAFDIWGDAVNLASRMESGSEPGRINISQSTYELVKNDFICSYRGRIDVKGKGEVEMYFVEKESAPVNMT
jgi:class 3 adenylate cyclase